MWPPCHQGRSQGTPGLAPAPWDSPARSHSLPSFTMNVFLSSLSPLVQILLTFPVCVQAPLSSLLPCLNSCPHLRVSACPSLMSHGIWFIVLVRALITLCLVLCNYLYIHPGPYLLIPSWKAWILFIALSQIRPGTVKIQQYLLNQCPNKFVVLHM